MQNNKQLIALTLVVRDVLRGSTCIMANFSIMASQLDTNKTQQYLTSAVNSDWQIADKNGGVCYHVVMVE